MSRLRSLQSPSPQPSPRPSSSSRSLNANPFPQDLTTYHRKLRALIGEVKLTLDTWDEEMKEAFGAAKGMVDEGTEIDNILSLPPSCSLPSIQPHLTLHQAQSATLTATFARLDRLLNKLRSLKDTAETLMLEAGKLKGWEFVLGTGRAYEAGEAFWEGGTWSMEKFVDSLQPLTIVHATHLSLVTSLSLPVASPLSQLPSSSSSPREASRPSRKPPNPPRQDTGDADEDEYPPPEEIPYDRQAVFEVQKAALESWADALGERSERGRWVGEWKELVEGEMGGWVGG